MYMRINLLQNPLNLKYTLTEQQFNRLSLDLQKYYKRI